MSNATLAAVNTVAERTDAKHRYVCWCVWCAEERDPSGELPIREAFGNCYCWSCGIPARERDGLLFVLVPDTHPAICQ